MVTSPAGDQQENPAGFRCGRDVASSGHTGLEGRSRGISQQNGRAVNSRIHQARVDRPFVRDVASVIPHERGVRSPWEEASGPWCVLLSRLLGSTNNIAVLLPPLYCPDCPPCPPVKEALAGKTQLSLPVHQVRFCFSLTHKYTHSPQSGSNPESLKTASYGFLTKSFRCGGSRLKSTNDPAQRRKCNEKEEPMNVLHEAPCKGEH